MANAWIPIVASSVGGNGTQSVDANGKITFSGGSILNINGVFSATYDNYVAVIDHETTTGSGVVRVRMRAAGTDNNAAEYSRQFYQRSGGSSTGDRDASQTEIEMFASVDNTCGTLLYFYRPYVSGVRTALRSVNKHGFTNATLLDYVAYVANTAAYDGWSIIGLSAGGSISGSMMIYGFTE